MWKFTRPLLVGIRFHDGLAPPLSFVILIKRAARYGKMAEWLRRKPRKLLGSPACVRITLLSTLFLYFNSLFFIEPQYLHLCLFQSGSIIFFQGTRYSAWMITSPPLGSLHPGWPSYGRSA